MDEEENPNPLEHCQTVGQLIAKLQQFDPNLPVLAVYKGWIRWGEYFPIRRIALDNLENQDTSGDPEYYGQAPCVLLASYG